MSIQCISASNIKSEGEARVSIFMSYFNIRKITFFFEVSKNAEVAYLKEHVELASHALELSKRRAQLEEESNTLDRSMKKHRKSWDPNLGVHDL